MRGNKTMSYSKCGLRKGAKYARRTAGGIWAMCSDGYLLPPVEMPDAESTRMTLYNILKWFDGISYPRSSSGNKLPVIYDDMCHLLR